MASAPDPTLSQTDTACRVATAIAAYAPGSLSAQAAEVVRAVVARAQPGTPARAKALLYSPDDLLGCSHARRRRQP